MARRLALLIGCSDYNDERLTQLVAPPHDVRELAAALSDPNIGGFSVETLINPTYDEARRKIDDFFSTSDPQDFQLLYFSGHGIRDAFGNLYLATPNTVATRFQSTAVDGGFVQQSMRLGLARQQVLILDCCYSGAYANGHWAKGDSFEKVAARFKGRGRVVMTASSAGQLAFETDNASGVRSVFTNWLVRGLSTGEADADRDGLVSAEELYYFARRGVVAERDQQPHLFTDGITGQLILAQSPGAGRSDSALAPSELPTFAEQPYVPSRADGRTLRLRSLVAARPVVTVIAAVLLAGALAMAGLITRDVFGETATPEPTQGEAGNSQSDASQVIQATFLRNWGATGDQDGEFDLPTSISAGAEGAVYVADSGNDRVQLLDEFGEHLLTFCEAGIDDGQCIFPMGLTANRDGILYVADSGNNRIQQFDRDGSHIRSWGSFSPWGLALDRDGNIFALDLIGQQVRVFNPDGVAIRTFGQMGTGDGEFQNPQGIFIDGNNLVYVGDRFNQRVQVFDTEGNFVRSIGNTGDPADSLDNPSAVAVDEHGNVFVADEDRNQILVYATDGEFIRTIGQGGKNASEFDRPMGVAVTEDTLYVVDQGNNRIQKFALEYS